MHLLWKLMNQFGTIHSHDPGPLKKEPLDYASANPLGSTGD
jgi:hypothetical protein